MYKLENAINLNNDKRVYVWKIYLKSLFEIFQNILIIWNKARQKVMLHVSAYHNIQKKTGKSFQCIASIFLILYQLIIFLF